MSNHDVTPEKQAHARRTIAAIIERDSLVDALHDLGDAHDRVLEKKHGGRRPGAGRPPSGDAPLVTTTVTLRPDQIERLEQLIADTGGSRSSIVRDALDAWMHPTTD